MKLIQVRAKSARGSLLARLNRKERSMRDGGKTTWSKAGKYKLVHTTYYGWVNVYDTPDGFLFARVKSRRPDQEAMLFDAFVGYLTRHIGNRIDSMTVYYYR